MSPDSRPHCFQIPSERLARAWKRLMEERMKDRPFTKPPEPAKPAPTPEPAAVALTLSPLALLALADAQGIDATGEVWS